ncbi:MAG: kelch repeat-containing protein [Candidatus Bathyarchaeia archaeon]
MRSPGFEPKWVRTVLWTWSLNPNQSARAPVEGKIYAIGGYKQGSLTLNTNEEYDPVTNTWTTRAPMPTARMEFGIAVWQDKI